MYEHAATLQIQPGKREEALHLLRTGVVSVLRAQPGLISLCLLPDPAQARITVISLWISKAHACAVEAARAYQEEVKKLEAFLDQAAVDSTPEAWKHEPVYRRVSLN